MAWARLRAYLDETHGSSFELTRHFLARFFDSEIATTSGDWLKVAIGTGATLLSVAILGLPTYVARYDGLQGLSNDRLYREGVREDLLSFIAIAMAATALLTLVHWRSLFPTLRDCLALAGSPVTGRQLFTAKFTALMMMFAAFVVVTTGPPAVLFAVVIGGRWQENSSTLITALANAGALAGACVFVFFSLLALQGILLNVLRPRMFDLCSIGLQGALFIAVLGGLPLIGRQPSSRAWWPPVWFVRLWEGIVNGSQDTTVAVVAITAPVLFAIALYLVSYHRYRRLLVESAAGRSSRHLSGIGSRLLEIFIRNPRQQAAFAFISKTLARSRTHQAILLAYAGIALGFITKGVLDTPRPSLKDEGMYGLAVLLAPIGLAMLATTGLRYLFSVPVLLPSNWIFRTTDEEGRRAWLAAVERFVISCGIAPIFIAALPAAVAIFGWTRAIAGTTLAIAVAMIWFELMFRKWRKVPFTCSYVPGKESVWITLTRYAFATLLLAPVGQLMLFCSNEPVAFAALLTFEIAVWRQLRKSRLQKWSESSLCYAEVTEAEVNPLELHDESGSPTEATIEPASLREPPMFASTLVESRGVLSQEWSDELAADRKSASTLLTTFAEDVRYGLRLIRRSPLLSSIVILTLTVGIGINASVFTVVNGLALRPHVYKDPNSFVRIVPQSAMQVTARQVSYSEYVAWRDHTRTLRQLAAFTRFPVMIGDDDSVGTFGLLVSCNFFNVDGLDRATLGRLLLADDCHTPGQAPVAVISETVWHTRLNSDPHVIERVISVYNRPVTIAGVAPDRTSGWTWPAGIWMPYTALTYFDPTRNFFAQEDYLWLNLAGRLAPGFSRSQARAELNVLAHQEDRLRGGRRTTIVTTNGSWAEELESTVSGRDLMLIGFFLVLLGHKLHILM